MHKVFAVGPMAKLIPATSITSIPVPYNSTHSTHSNFPLLDTQADTFIIACPNVGDIQQLRIRSNGGGLGPAWHLSHVQVTCSTAPDTAVHFTCAQWFDQKHGLEKLLLPDKDGDGMVL